MHELSVSDVFRPAPVSVLNLPLAVYSIGHELLLFRRRNALALLPPQEFSELDFVLQMHAIREAVWICSDPFSVRDRFEKPSAFMWRFRWNEWKRRLWVRRTSELLPQDYALAAADFRNYLEEAHPRIPAPGKHAIEVLYGDEERPGRTLGQPMLLSLYQMVLALPASERPRCAWDYPFAQATWMFFAQMESAGNYRIENFEERDEQSVMDEPVGKNKHRTSNIEHRTSNEEENCGVSVPVATVGLATEPPDLSDDSQPSTLNPQPGEWGEA